MDLLAGPSSPWWPAYLAAAIEGATAVAEEVGSRSLRWRSARMSKSSPWTSSSLPHVSKKLECAAGYMKV
ncbi:hypothetical protein SORBI_3008G081700 [Sorghum bicolor]|uniref:Uncharacterized protein n=1 Tax=Sorghum bicolor TaxID=4558 RepID=A0A1B6PC68_SORBI|nr:hypothetical protein SORBI_3008G081700 [Sorghum bicolor]